MPFDSATLLAYTAAATLLVLIPGPGTAWIIAQSVAGGTRRGAIAGLGLETATLLHAAAAGFGLSAVLATSAIAFETIKFAGAVYLVWLGLKAWRDAAGSTSERGDGDRPATSATTALRSRSVYFRSVLTGLLNPKVALFFLAFLPQFVHPEIGMAWLQFLVLGAILSLVGMTHSLALSFAIGHLGRRFSANPRATRQRRRIAGTVFAGLGLRLAFEQRS